MEVLSPNFSQPDPQTFDTRTIPIDQPASCHSFLIDDFGTIPTEPQDYAGLSDDELVEVARRGAGAAFGELIARHQRECFRRAQYIMRNADDARDEVQNAFWKAFRSLEQFRRQGTFAAWLNRIVENQCLMHIRERHARCLYLDQSNASNVKLELVSQDVNPEDQFGQQEVATMLYTEISMIPSFLRHVLILRDVEQLPLADIAAELNISIPAAKSRLVRARNELRSRIQKHCGRRGVVTLTQKSSYPMTAHTTGSPAWQAA